MKKVVIGIFAHPDDEGFGPSGSLHKLALAGADIHLLLATNGDAGNNPDRLPDLGKARLKEWHQSGKLIGAKSMHSFGYKDGSLCNNVYVELAKKIRNHVGIIVKKYDEPIELSFFTLDRNGLTGHIDHIVISNITTLIYEYIKSKPSKKIKLKELKYFCVCKDFAAQVNTDWIYMPAGHAEADFDEVNDITDVFKQKLKILQAHKSQRADMNAILERYGDSKCGKQERFMYYRD